MGSILPLMLIGLPRLYGAWHHVMTGLLQHGGLADNVLDHRLNSRTVYMNPVSRFIYWNMNYHVEHHMFPMVPYHALPQLHEMIKHDLPAPNPSILDGYREMIPAFLRQLRNEDYFLKRELPPTAKPYREEFHGEPTRRGRANSSAAGRAIDGRKNDEQLDRSLRRRRHRRGGRDPLRPWRPHLRDLPQSPTTSSSPPTACARMSRSISPTAW